VGSVLGVRLAARPLLDCPQAEAHTRWVADEEGRVEMPTSTAARARRLSPLELVVLAAPLLWLVPAFVHPNEAGDLFDGIADQANKWIFVHVAQLVLTPFIAAGVWMLLGGVQSVPAQVARAALVIWMVFFSAFDAIAGIATGVLTRYANSLAGQERETVGRAIDFLFHDSQLAGEFSVLGNIGHGAWVVLAIAAAVALWGARLSRVIVWATLVSVLFASHSGIGAAVGLLALFVAELLSFLSRSGEAAPSKALEPA
jgi:hypothetical protein